VSRDFRTKTKVILGIRALEIVQVFMKLPVYVTVPHETGGAGVWTPVEM
jgi:3-deoxy-D-arabino-heptulosonate 7-phosphate (DAHP) synthase